MPAVSIVLELIRIRWNHKSLQLLSSGELDFIIASVYTGPVSYTHLTLPTILRV